jgi:hypothetical protein
VLGGDWSPWLVAAVGVGAVAAALIAWILFTAQWRTPQTGPPVPTSSRAEALKELDRLLALGWHTDGRDGRINEFYDATTGVLRRLSEAEQDLSRALTSSELVAQIEQRWGAGSVAKLRPTVWSAERVKFGTHRPGAQAAEEDWTVVRDWIRALPEL